jgi:hypothetical protein
MVATEAGAIANRREGFLMRHFMAAVLIICACALIGTTPASAVGTTHAFCLQGYEYPGLSYCPFDTYAQCQATASGRNLTCVANPYFVGESDDPYAYQNRGRAFPPAYIPVPPNAYRYRRY